MEKWEIELAEIRAIMAETAKKTAETAKLMDENAKGFARVEKLQEENAKDFAEMRALQKEENAKGFAEIREIRALQKENEATRKKYAEEAEKRLLKLEALVGNTVKNIGFSAEEFFQNAFAETLTFAGVKFDKMYPNWQIVGKESCEFDIVLVNGESAALIEVKNRIHPNFIDEMMTEKLVQFKKHFKEIPNPKIYLGIAGLSFPKATVEKANKYGIGIISQKGNSIEVNTDFVKEQ